MFFGGGQETAPYRAIQALFIQKNFYHAIAPTPSHTTHTVPHSLALHFFCLAITCILLLHIGTGMSLYITEQWLNMISL